MFEDSSLKPPTFIFRGEGKGTELTTRAYQDYIFKVEAVVAQKLKSKGANVFDFLHHSEEQLDSSIQSDVYWIFAQTTDGPALQIVKQFQVGDK